MKRLTLSLSSGKDVLDLFRKVDPVERVSNQNGSKEVRYAGYHFGGNSTSIATCPGLELMRPSRSSFNVSVSS
jgi:hypothetical protein